MNKSILNNSAQEFINENLNSNIHELLLKKISFPGVESIELVAQIEAKNKCKSKLLTWFNTPNIYYPNKLNIEQTSSEATAAYKSKLASGASIIDLTGGFGVDCFYFSRLFKQVTHCEIDEKLSSIVEHNYKQFNALNISVIASDGLTYLKNSKKVFNWIYIDPSRRHDSKGKVFFLNDCLPKVPEHLPMLFEHSDNIMIKTSPLLDISIGISELEYVKDIHIVAVNNEVKELLWVLEKGFVGEPMIKTTNIKNNTLDNFEFVLNEEQNCKSDYELPLNYLYEPNAAILKSGGFNCIASQLNIYKLHKHSHLYTSETLIDFPGRKFKIERVIPYRKKLIKKEAITKANITTRNFPERVEQIQKKFNIKDGGDSYLFFTTNMKDERIMVIAAKVK